MDRNELLKLSQCGGHESDLDRMEGLIMDKLQWYLEAVNHYGFIMTYLEAVLNSIYGGFDAVRPQFLSDLMHKIEVVTCQFEFTKYRVSEDWVYF